MRTFIRGRVTRVIAQALTLMFLWSAVFLGLPVVPGEAQIAMRAAATQSVAVVPFDNRSRFALETLGAEASEAVTVELRERLQLDVLPADEVAIDMRDLGIKSPLSDSELIRLASQLEVTMVVTGEVRSAAIVRDRAGRHAEVTLAVSLFDRTAEGVVNGALVTGKAPAAEGDDTTLVRKALEQAAFEAIQEMRTRPTVSATVLWNREDVVYVSAGSRSGVEMGTQMAVIRGGQRIALVQITSSDALGAYGRLVSGPQLRPGDQLRALYRLPSKVGALPPVKVAQKKRGMETLLIGTLGLLGLANIGAAGRLAGEGNVAAPGFTVSDLANGVALGYAWPSFLGDPSQPGNPAVLINFQPYSDTTEKSRVIAYEIWSDAGAMVTFTSPLEEPFAGPEWNQIIHWVNDTVTSYWSGSITINATTGAVAFTAGLSSKDPTENIAYNIAWSEGATTITYTWPALGPIPGRATIYRIKPVLAIQDIYGVWSLTRDTELSTAIQKVTPVSPPLAGAVFADGMEATFEFYTPRGADEAIIQIARDPNDSFPPTATYSQTIQGTWSGVGFYDRDSMLVDLNQLLSLPGSGSYYWYRFGSRNRYDTNRPRPYPSSQVNDRDWVWSDVQRLDLAAGGRELAAHRERDVLARSQFGRTRLMERRRPDRPLHIH